MLGSEAMVALKPRFHNVEYRDTVPLMMMLSYTPLLQSLEAVIVNGIKGRGKEMKFSKLLSPRPRHPLLLFLSPNFPRTYS